MLLGALIVVSPWFPFSSHDVMDAERSTMILNTFVVGMLIFGLAQLEYVALQRWEEVGEIALGSQFQADVILVIADLSEMEAQVNVDENDIVSIHPGQDAEIQTDALLAQPLKGRVSEISSSANTAEIGRAHV